MVLNGPHGMHCIQCLEGSNVVTKDGPVRTSMVRWNVIWCGSAWDSTDLLPSTAM